MSGRRGDKVDKLTDDEIKALITQSEQGFVHPAWDVYCTKCRDMAPVLAAEVLEWRKKLDAAHKEGVIMSEGWVSEAVELNPAVNDLRHMASSHEELRRRWRAICIENRELQEKLTQAHKDYGCELRRERIRTIQECGRMIDAFYFAKSINLTPNLLSESIRIMIEQEKKNAE